MSDEQSRTSTKTKTLHDFMEFSIDGTVKMFAPYHAIGRHPLAPEGTITRKLPDQRPGYGHELPHPRIGENSVVGVNAVIYAGVVIGKNCLIGDGAVIRENTRIGDFTIIGQQCNISHDCNIGSHVKIMELSQVCGLTKIGDNVFIGPHFASANDDNLLHPDFGKFFKPSPITIEDDVRIGVQVCVLPGVTIGRRAIVTAGSLVTRDTTAGQVVSGRPASLIAFIRDGEEHVTWLPRGL